MTERPSSSGRSPWRSSSRPSAAVSKRRGGGPGRSVTSSTRRPGPSGSLRAAATPAPLPRRGTPRYSGALEMFRGYETARS
ncbi:hypothetical protein GTW63_03655 [Streptomyces sp. SID6137]|nr:hypothetical protein [Streptomyces sp. SID6139]MYR17444.1 hypothetical protein [Streptomyces sp. SID6137]